MDNTKLVFFIKHYWSYYLRMESEFISTLNYVEFEESNFDTYSLKYLSLYLSVCSEIDVVGKFLAHEANNNFDLASTNTSIVKWWYEIQNSFMLDNKKLNKQKVNFYKIQEKTPWKEFKVRQSINSLGRKYLVHDSTVPIWWSNYNKVKHNRTGIDSTNNKPNYTKANLFNISEAFAGLYVLEHAFINSISTISEIRLIQKSKLFENEKILTTEINGNTLSINEMDAIK